MHSNGKLYMSKRAIKNSIKSPRDPPKHMISIELDCVNRDVTIGCMRLVKPKRVFSRPASLATPFWITTLPECKCVTVGNPRSFRKISASNIWRPIRCTCGRVSPLPRDVYLWLQSSFQQFRSICSSDIFCCQDTSPPSERVNIRENRKTMNFPSYCEWAVENRSRELIYVAANK